MQVQVCPAAVAPTFGHLPCGECLSIASAISDANVAGTTSYAMASMKQLTMSFSMLDLFKSENQCLLLPSLASAGTCLHRTSFLGNLNDQGSASSPFAYIHTAINPLPSLHGSDRLPLKA